MEIKIKTNMFRAPHKLFEGIEKVRLNFHKKGLLLTRTEVAEKLGNDLLNEKITIDVPVFKKNKKEMINLGGLFNAKVRKVKK